VSVKLIGEVLELDLAPALKLLLLAIAYRINHDKPDLGMWLSVPRLAKATSRSERTVQRNLRELEAIGLIKVVQRGGGRAKAGHHATTTYAITLPSRDDRLSPLEVTPMSSTGDTDVTSRGDRAVSPKQEEAIDRDPKGEYPSRVPAPRGHFSAIDDRWGSYKGVEWTPFKEEWLGRGFSLPPTQPQRDLLWPMVDARPNDVAAWVRQAPAGLPAADVIKFVIEQMDAFKACLS
jgi:hypothetical protein